MQQRRSMNKLYNSSQTDVVDGEVLVSIVLDSQDEAVGARTRRGPGAPAYFGGGFPG